MLSQSWMHKRILCCKQHLGGQTNTCFAEYQTFFLLHSLIAPTKPQTNSCADLVTILKAHFNQTNHQTVPLPLLQPTWWWSYCQVRHTVHSWIERATLPQSLSLFTPGTLNWGGEGGRNAPSVSLSLWCRKRECERMVIQWIVCWMNKSLYIFVW